jgi:hypothetical protein
MPVDKDISLRVEPFVFIKITAFCSSDERFLRRRGVFLFLPIVFFFGINPKISTVTKFYKIFSFLHIFL